MANYTGTIGNNSITGTSGADTFDYSQGGDDTILGGGGDDTITMGAALAALDRINGGLGNDTVTLQGDYSAGLTLGAQTIVNVETLKFGSGFSYKIITADGTIAPGATLSIDGYNMSSGQSLYIDASAETNGHLSVLDGQGNDTFYGGAQSDGFTLAYGGNDAVHAGAGDDSITMYGTFAAGDVIDGGAGSDALYLAGDYSASLPITATMMSGIETLIIGGNFNYILAVEDGCVAAGQNLFVDAESVGAGYSARFYGALETDGTFSFRDGAGSDLFIGGANGDTFEDMHGGNDSLSGGGGNDIFEMFGNLTATDQISGGTGNDWVSLDGDYSAGVTLGTYTMTGVESITFAGGHSYKLITNDNTVAAGQQLVVSSQGLTASDTLYFDGSAELDGTFQFYGGAGNDTFFGGAGKDYFDAHAGGNDSFHGGGSDDTVSFFGGYTTADFVDGGSGNDNVNLDGTLGATFKLGAAQFVNVESISFGGGFNYNIVAQDSLVAAGATLSVDSYYNDAAHGFNFNGAAELDGHFNMTGGMGNDHLIGGQQSDTFFLNRSGNDSLEGRGGDDTFYVSSDFTAADRIVGGTGTDTIVLGADLGAGLLLGANTVVSIERINLVSGHGYKLVTNDGNVAAGQTLTVDGSYLGASDGLNFNGSAETTGHFNIEGGAANDSLTGGAVADTLSGGLGTDHLYGGGGKDLFVFGTLADSASKATADVIHDWNAGDRIDLTGIDADSSASGDQAFTFIGNAAFSAAGQLQVINNGVTTFVSGDVNGDGVADFVIKLSGVQSLADTDFLL